MFTFGGLTMTPDEMRENADMLSGCPIDIRAVWRLAAELCERLDTLNDTLAMAGAVTTIDPDNEPGGVTPTVGTLPPGHEVDTSIFDKHFHQFHKPNTEQTP